MTFPTAVVDLRPAAAGYDRALAWMTRYRGLRAVGVPVARWTRRLVIRVHDIHRRTFAPGTPDQHEMLCLWVTNGGAQDVHGIRFQTRWNADDLLFNVKTADGLWLGVREGQPGQSLDRASSRMGLVAGGSADFVGQYVGLAVKYLDDEHAYVVTPDSFGRFRREATWRWPSDAIATGLHLVDLSFRSRDGGAAFIRLKIMNPGRGAALGAHLAGRPVAG